MFTIFFVFVLIVVSIPLSIAAQRWLFKGTNEVCNPELELYQQRYD